MIAFGGISASKIYLGSTEVGKAYLGSNLIWSSGPRTDSDWVKISGASSVGLVSLSSNQSIEYSLDSGSTWNALGTANDVAPNGEVMYVRGVLSGNNDASNFTQFKMTGESANSLAVYGNLANLWNYNDIDAPIKEYCGYQLFSGCTDIHSVGQLKITGSTLAADCYERMFDGCGNIDAMPVFSANAVAYRSCRLMFSYCSSLTTASVPQALTLAEGCYDRMFRGCTSLTSVSTMPAATVSTTAYQYMFDGCSNLESVTCLATDVSATDATKNWLRGVNASGTFTKAASMTSWASGDSGIPAGWTVQDAA